MSFLSSRRVPFRPACLACVLLTPLLAPLRAEADSLPGHYLAAIVAGAQKDTKAEASYLRRVLREDPQDDAILDRAFIASVTNGDMRESFALARKVLARDPGHRLAHFVLGVRALKLGRWDRARDELGKSSGGPFDLAVVAMTAWSWAGARDFDRALEILDELKDERVGRFRDYHAGIIAEMAGYTYEAKKRFRATFEGDRNTLRTVDAWARFLSRRGDMTQARQTYEDFEKLLPRNPILLSGLHTLAAGKALPPLVTDAATGAGEVLYGIGAANLQQSDAQVSMAYLRLSLYLAPKNELATTTLADIYERLKQRDRALDVYASMPRDAHLRTGAEIQSALILEAAGRKREAEQSLRGIIARQPRNIAAITSLADIYRSRKDWRPAAAGYTRALDLIGTTRASDWGWFFSRGIAYDRSKQWALAEPDLKKAMDLQPDNAQVLNYLAYSWADQNIRLDEALVLLRKAVTLARTDGNIIDSLGWVLYRLGRYDEALVELEQAVKLTPAEPTINEHLGDVYWKVGRKIEARFQWNHARDLKPEPEDLVRILDKLAQPDEQP